MSLLINSGEDIDDALLKLMTMDFKSILAFIVVVDTGNLYCASLLLGCSQPAVSIYIKRARSYFNHPLFTREGRCLNPTEYAIKLSGELKQSLAGFMDVLISNTTTDTDILSSHVEYLKRNFISMKKKQQHLA